MSNYQENEKELDLRKISEEKNPFSSDCKNRNLWSMGYRQCAIDLAEWKSSPFFPKPPINEQLLVELSNGDKVLSFYRESENEKEVNMFDCEKETGLFAKAYRRISFL